MNDYLEHHGILGMRWGVRRFQNEDGSLTSAGKKRYSSDGIKKGIGKALDPSIPQGKGKANISPAEKIGKETVNISSSAEKILDNYGNISRSRKQKRNQYAREAESMTDAELRQRINRIQMETQYVNLRSSDLDAGYERAKEVIGLVGGVAAIATSGLTIASAVRKLRSE